MQHSKFLFICPQAPNGLLLLLLYVDDFILTGENFKTLGSFINVLSTEFRMKDLGSLHYFLGIKVHKSPTGLYLALSKYARDLLVRSGMESCKSIATPMVVCKKLLLKDDDAPYLDPSHYRSIVGALQYLTLTMPDLPFSINSVCQFM